MATVVLGAIGAGIGSIFGEAQLGWAAGTIAAGLFRHKEKPQERGKLDDLRVTSSAYGAAIPLCWGMTKVGGNLIWSTNLDPHVKTTHVGKGGGGEIKNYTYSASFAILWAGNIQWGVRRVWFGDLTVYDVTKDPASEHPCVHYLGDGPQTVDFIHRKNVLDQMPDPIILGKQPDRAPAYRGRCYSVFYDWPLEKWADSLASLNPVAELACAFPLPDLKIPIGTVSFDFGVDVLKFHTQPSDDGQPKDGAEIIRWDDSHADHRLYPDVEVGPVYRKTFRNGLPVARFGPHTAIGDGNPENWRDLHAPAHVFAALYIDDWVKDDWIFGGILGVRCVLGASTIRASADGGHTWLDYPGQPNTWFVLEVLFNGANSWITVNGGEKTIGDVGGPATSNLAGLNLAQPPNTGSFYMGRIRGYSGGQSNVDRNAIISAFKAQWGIV